VKLRVLLIRNVSAINTAHYSLVHGHLHSNQVATPEQAAMLIEQNEWGILQPSD